MGGTPAWWLGEGLTTLHRKKIMLRIFQIGLGSGRILEYDLSDGKGT